MAGEDGVNEKGATRGAQDDPHAVAVAPSFEVAGNRLTLLAGGSERFEALLALIRGAKRTLRLLYYIYVDDAAGRALRDAMAEALARGVRVSLIVDGFGSALPQDYFAALQQQGGDVCRFIPRFGRRYFLRNHQKLALADETQAIIGGFNIQDSYFDDVDGWRDLGLIVEGPAAKRLTGYFDALSRWTHRDASRLRDLRRALRRWSEPEGGPAGPPGAAQIPSVRWLFGGPMRRLSPWARTVKREMEHARSLRLIAGYFVPSPRMMRRIEGIAKRGGIARVITPARTDHAAAVAAARHTYRRLLKRGVRIFEYQKHRLHTKLFVIDDIVHVGSANFDMRSMFLNLELMLRIDDPAFAAFMRDYFEKEVAGSREVTAAGHARHGWLDRLRWAAAYFIMAVVDARVTRRLNFGVHDDD